MLSMTVMNTARAASNPTPVPSPTGGTTVRNKFLDKILFKNSMIYTIPSVVARRITPQKAAFEHCFGVFGALRAELHGDYLHDL